MYLATAYPNSALSAPTMLVIALVMAGTLALWLVLVFLADREPRVRRQALAGEAAPGGATAAHGIADGKHDELEEGHTTGEHRGVAA